MVLLVADEETEEIGVGIVDEVAVGVGFDGITGLAVTAGAGAAGFDFGTNGLLLGDNGLALCGLGDNGFGLGPGAGGGAILAGVGSGLTVGVGVTDSLFSGFLIPSLKDWTGFIFFNSFGVGIFLTNGLDDLFGKLMIGFLNGTGATLAEKFVNEEFWTLLIIFSGSTSS